LVSETAASASVRRQRLSAGKRLIEQEFSPARWPLFQALLGLLQFLQRDDCFKPRHLPCLKAGSSQAPIINAIDSDLKDSALMTSERAEPPRDIEECPEDICGVFL
jgi:hypothetical protein